MFESLKSQSPNSLHAFSFFGISLLAGELPPGLAASMQNGEVEKVEKVKWKPGFAANDAMQIQKG